MTIGRVSGSMLVSNLDRQGTDLQFTNNNAPIVYLDVTHARAGFANTAPTETVTINGNLSTTNVLVDGLTISAKANATLAITSNINLGSNATVKLTGGQNNDILFTDGAGNLHWGSLAGNVYTNNIIGISGNLTLSPAAPGNFIVNSNTSMVLPTGTTSNRPTTAAGAVRFNLDTNTPEFFNGTSWINLSTQITTQTITPDGVSQIYTLDNASTSIGIIVSINGTLQQPNTAYTVVGTQITFAEIPLITDIVEIRFISASTVIEENTNVVSAAAITVDNTLTLLDSFDKTLYQAAKYTISAKAASGDTQLTEIFVTHNGTIAASTINNNVTAGGTVIQTYAFVASVSGSNVLLNATAVAPGAQVRVQKLYFLL